VVHVTGYGPLFALLGVFDILGAVLLVVLLRGVVPVDSAPVPSM
jgi:hypothetical protein